MIRWLGLLAPSRASRPRAGGAQDTTTAHAQRGHRLVSSPPGPGGHPVAPGGARAGPGEQPDVPPDPERRRPRQVGRAQRLRQPAPDRQRGSAIWATSASGSPTSAAASCSRPPRSSPRGTTSASNGSSTAGCSPVPGQQKALQRATDEDISGAGVDLRGEIDHPVPQHAAGDRAGRSGAAAGGAQRRLPDARAGALSGGPGHAARRASGRGDQGAVATSPCCARSSWRTRRSSTCCAGWAWSRRSPVDQIALSDSFPVTPPGFSSTSCSRWRTSRTPRSARSAPGRTPPPWSVRAARSRVPAHAVCAGRMERVHPGVHQRDVLAGDRRCRRAQVARGELPVRQPGADGARPRRPASRTASAAFGLNSSGTALDTGASQQIRPRREQRLPLRLHRPAVPGQPDGSRCPSSPASAARSGCPRRGPQEQDADEDVRARRLQVRSDVHARYLGAADRLPGDRRPGGQPRGRAGPAPAGAGPLPARARAPRSRCPTRRTPSSRPRATT